VSAKRKKVISMLTMNFKLDTVGQGNYTKEEMETKIRNFFSGINAAEIDYLCFQRDDPYAVGAFGNIFKLMMHDPRFLNSLAECFWTIDGETENCLEEVKDTLRNIKM
jgi:hypothetical protein